jgi:hypothetical protein
MTAVTLFAINLLLTFARPSCVPGSCMSDARDRR